MTNEEKQMRRDLERFHEAHRKAIHLLLGISYVCPPSDEPSNSESRRAWDGLITGVQTHLLGIEEDLGVDEGTVWGQAYHEGHREARVNGW